MSESVEKACYFCGKSCVGQPRGKDPRGRYYHRACLEDARGRPTSADPHDDEPLADDPFADEPLLELNAPGPAAVPPVMSGQACPECGAAIAGGAVLCTSCGLDLRTGGHAFVAGKAPKSRGGGRAVWPVIIGSISILLGIIGIGYAVLTGTSEMMGNAPARLVGPIINGLLALFLLLGGAQMTMRNEGCVRTLRIWAITKLALTVLCTGLVVALFGLANSLSEELGQQPELAELNIGTLIGAMLVVAALSLVWPTFILIWLGRDGVKKEIGSW